MNKQPQDNNQFFEQIEQNQFEIALPDGRRNFESTAVIGAKRQGKTTWAKYMIAKYHAAYPERPILVCDYSDAFGPSVYPNGAKYPGIPLIALDELINGKKVKVKGQLMIRRWNLSGLRRVTGYNNDEQVKALFDYISTKFKGGLVVIDEATVIFPPTAQMEHRGLLIKHTNSRNDIWALFHGLSYVPVRLRKEFWRYILFQTPDSYQTWKDLARDEFARPEEFFEKWKEAQDAPQGNRLIQYHTIFELKAKQS
jgi:hypothetical protein